MTPHRLPDFTTIPVYAVPCPSADYYTRLPLNCKSFNAYNFIHTGNGLTYTNRIGLTIIQRVACTGSWSWQPVSCVCDKTRNIVPRAGIEPMWCNGSTLAFQASVLPLHHIGFLMSPLYRCTPVYAAPCLRGQCRHSQRHRDKSYSVLCPHNRILAGWTITLIYRK